MIMMIKMIEMIKMIKIIKIDPNESQWITMNTNGSQSILIDPHIF